MVKIKGFFNEVVKFLKTGYERILNERVSVRIIYVIVVVLSIVLLSGCVGTGDTSIVRVSRENIDAVIEEIVEENNLTLVFYSTKRNSSYAEELDRLEIPHNMGLEVIEVLIIYAINENNEDVIILVPFSLDYDIVYIDSPYSLEQIPLDSIEESLSNQELPYDLDVLEEGIHSMIILEGSVEVNREILNKEINTVFLLDIGKLNNNLLVIGIDVNGDYILINYTAGLSDPVVVDIVID